MSNFSFPCRNGTYGLPKDDYDDLTHTYPEMDVDMSLAKLRDYLTAHPEKQGYVSSAKGYVSMWLREDNEQGRYRKKKDKGYKPTYDLSEYESTSVLDEIDDWDDDP